MKVLLINKYLYPRGGDAISTLTTGDLLRKHGHQVVFWGMAHPQNRSLEEFKEYWLPFIDLNDIHGIINNAKVVANMLYSFQAKSTLSHLLDKFRPDVLHLNNFAHQISPSILDEFQKRTIPSVMTIRDYKLVCPTIS